MRNRVVATITMLLAAVISPACLELDTTNGGSGGAGGSSTSSGLTVPDDCSGATQSCDVCEVCSSQTEGGACTAEYTACQFAKACVMLDQCVHACPAGDSGCIDGCSAMVPSDDAAYGAYFKCVYCKACSKSCASTIPCPG